MRAMRDDDDVPPPLQSDVSSDEDDDEDPVTTTMRKGMVQEPRDRLTVLARSRYCERERYHVHRRCENT